MLALLLAMSVPRWCGDVGLGCLGYVVGGLVASLSDRRPDRIGIEATAHEVHADALEGLSIARQGPAAEVTSERVGRAFRLVGGHRLILGTALGCAMLGPVFLDDVPRHPVLTELGLDHPHAPGRMAIALLAPPAGEGCVVEVAELAKSLDDLTRSPGSGVSARRRRRSISHRVLGRVPR